MLQFLQNSEMIEQHLYFSFGPNCVKETKGSPLLASRPLSALESLAVAKGCLRNMVMFLVHRLEVFRFHVPLNADLFLVAGVISFVCPLMDDFLGDGHLGLVGLLQLCFLLVEVRSDEFGLSAAMVVQIERVFLCFFLFLR